MSKSKFLFLCIGIVSFFVLTNQSNAQTKFTKGDLAKLRWIEGKWRGSSSDGKVVFYERYSFVGGGKIEINSFASDSTFTKAKNRGSVYVKNGEIIHKSGKMLWSAGKLTDSLIEFAPKKKATNSFSWQKDSDDLWIAKLFFKDDQGNPKDVVFKMERTK